MYAEEYYALHNMQYFVGSIVVVGMSWAILLKDEAQSVHDGAEQKGTNIQQHERHIRENSEVLKRL